MKNSFAQIVQGLDSDLQARVAAKVPQWSGVRVTVPTRLAAEQCSSAVTAMYKADLCLNSGARHIADLTGGLGVDSWAFSTIAEEVLYNEPDPSLNAAVRQNFGSLGISNVIFSGACATKGEIRSLLNGFRPDLIYLDPARRSASGRKVFLLEDCTPDILDLKDELLDICPEVMVKLSPMADISMVASRLGSCVREIHVLGADGECKELLCLLRKGFEGQYSITLAENNSLFRFLPDEERTAAAQGPSHGERHSLLYVPGSAALKAGPVKLIAQEYGLKKLAPFTHMYFCNAEVPELLPFGKFLPVTDIRPLNGSSLRQIGREFPKCEITARNVPMTSEEMRKKTGAAGGGSARIFGVTIAWTDSGPCRQIIISGS